MTPKKILFLTPYPFDVAPSQRFRFEQYYDILESNGFLIDERSFLTVKGWRILYVSGRSFSKFFYVFIGCLRRVVHLWKVLGSDYVFVHREVAPLGPPVFEFMISKIFRKQLIYDFDDSIWIPNTSQQNGLARYWKWTSKVKKICQWASQVTVGNDYLAEYARIYASNVQVIPTTIKANQIQEAPLRNESKVLGWTGTHSTLKYLEKIAPELNRLIEKENLSMMVICNQRPSFELKNLIFQKWSKDSEIEDLLKMDIGLMPLKEDEWSNGKCGFKALQYMALGIPCVISPVGVNQQIIKESGAGLLSDDKAWEKNIEIIRSSVELRREMASKGVGYIRTKYSNEANFDAFLALFSA